VIQDAIRAAKLEPDFYNAIEHDRSYTMRALVLVVIVSAASGIGSAIGVEGVSRIEGPVTDTITGLAGWFLWSASAAFIGRRFFAGTTDLGEMLRVLGYAQAPRIIGIIPLLGPVGWAWALVAGVVAVREGQELTTGRAALVVVTGGAVVVLLNWFAALVFGRML
jgi:hypothetical protein